MNTHTLRKCRPWLMLVVAWSAHAADGTLTMDDAIAIATRSAPQVAGRQAMIEGARAMSLGAGRLPDPELVAGVHPSRDAGAGLARSKQVTGPGSSLTPNLTDAIFVALLLQSHYNMKFSPFYQKLTINQRNFTLASYAR